MDVNTVNGVSMTLPDTISADLLHDQPDTKNNTEYQTPRSRVVASRQAFLLLSRIASLGRHPVRLDDAFGPQIRQARKLDLPLPNLWRGETTRPICSKKAFRLLQATLQKLSGNNSPPPLPDHNSPEPPKFEYYDVFERITDFTYPIIEEETAMQENVPQSAPVIPQDPPDEATVIKTLPLKRKPADTDDSENKRPKPTLSPVSFYNAREIYRYTGDRSVRTSWEKHPTKQSYNWQAPLGIVQDFKENLKAHAMLARAVAPRPPESYEHRSWDQQEGSNVHHDLVPDHNSSPSTKPMQAQELLSNSFDSKAMTMVGGKYLDESILLEAIAEVPGTSRPGTAYSEFPEEALEQLQALEARTSPEAARPAPEQPTADDDALILLIKRKKQAMALKDISVTKSLIFGSPFNASSSPVRRRP